MLKRLARSLATTLVFGFAFVINPAYVAGCASSVTHENESDPENENDPAQNTVIKSELVEMLDDLNGTGAWQFEYEGESYELLLALTQQEKPAAMASAPGASPFISTAHACGSVTFYQSASACITNYQLALEGTLTLRRLGAKPETIVSDFALDGAVENFGSANFTFGEDGYLNFQRAKDGSFAIARFMTSGIGSEKLTFAFTQAGL